MTPAPDTSAINAFRQARFGMFIHWGLYALPGGRWKGEIMDYIGEWLQARFRIPNAEYARLAERFDPVDFDADAWVRLAAEAGIRYLVFTTKHHDGFAMYHSKVSPFNIVDATPFGRDVLKELAEACARHGVKLGLYYSHALDWEDPDGADPGPDMHSNFGMSWGNDWEYPERKEKDFARYLERKAKPQLKELLTGYGPIFTLWFDCPLVITPEQSAEIRQWVKSFQPDCLINSRIGHGMEDFGSLGDNQRPTGRSEYPLESPVTLNKTWGFKWDDDNWVEPRKIACELATLMDKNVNYLVNVGPQPDGRFPEASVDILQQLAQWRKAEQVTIQGAGPNPFAQDFPWGCCTTTDSGLQLFVTNWQPILNIHGLLSPVRSASVPFTQDGDSLTLTLPQSHSLLPVIHIDCGEPPRVDTRLMPQQGRLDLMPSLADIRHGEPTKLGKGANLLGAAAEKFDVDAPCSLDAGGALMHWHHPGDKLIWRIYVPEGGRYRISVITENQLHSAPWVGGREVAIGFDNQTLKGCLGEDSVLSTEFYASSLSQVGELEISARTEHVISLENLAISTPQEAHMNLVALRLEKIGD
ncbi:alpha-L-fucosidase [Ruficoccus sp. ZRK36]|uniref:alpha-L-fucosidase n=1 Tax=Ruficoccus sp. ZRK36 TaxID=2866311 RepID=UPI001C7317D1|nr:alpha-L-fucosidase [Ruficoccus sp. ZRK36]QYY35982.1 alpha-L-fucosidase [Ruficoccus sp. ZRK36]